MNPLTIHEQRMIGVIGLILFGAVIVTVGVLAAWHDFTEHRDHIRGCRVPGCIQCGGPR